MRSAYSRPNGCGTFRLEAGVVGRLFGSIGGGDAGATRSSDSEERLLHLAVGSALGHLVDHLVMCLTQQLSPRCGAPLRFASWA